MLATIVLSVVVFAVVVSMFLWVRAPGYRLERRNVIQLLEMVVEGRASENDWRVFVGVPLRHDPYLEQVRQQCMDIEERTYMGKRRSGALFSESGLDELRALLAELRARSVSDSGPS